MGRLKMREIWFSGRMTGRAGSAGEKNMDTEEYSLRVFGVVLNETWTVPTYRVWSIVARMPASSRRKLKP